MSDDKQRSDCHPDDDTPQSSADTSRREFLKASAAVASASLLSGCLSDSDDQTELTAAQSLQRFQHVLVVMFENRSLDNVLGYLYQPGQVPRNQTYNGVAGVTYSNPVPSYIDDGHTSVSTRVSPGTDADFSNPNPDPGEGYPHMNTQWYDIVDPQSNQFLDSGQMQPPYNAPAPPQQPTMTGFVHDYCNNFVVTTKRVPTFDEYRVIMDGFSNEQLPVLSTLASGFAVYDHWHCAVPTQTFCNRSRRAHAELSQRQFQIFCKLAAGESVSKIAGELNLSVKRR